MPMLSVTDGGRDSQNLPSPINEISGLRLFCSSSLHKFGRTNSAGSSFAVRAASVPTAYFRGAPICTSVWQIRGCYKSFLDLQGCR